MSKGRILFADDDVDTREMMAKYLQLVGYNVFHIRVNTTDKQFVFEVSRSDPPEIPPHFFGISDDRVRK